MEQVQVFMDLDMEEVAQRLRRRRETIGLTQQAVAWRADMSQARYVTLERGRGGMQINTLYKLCQVLQVSSDYLLGLRKEDA